MKYFKALFLVFVIVNMVQAQFSKHIEVSSYWDDNLYRTPQAVNDILTDFNMRLSYRPGDSNITYFYDGDLFLYQKTTLRNFSMHNAGLNYFYPFGKEEKHTFYIGANYTLRLNQDEYNYYDYNQFYVYTTFRFDLNWAFIRSGYNFRYRSYSNLPDISNYKHYFFVQLNKSFATRTTVILEADIGRKSFDGQEIVIGISGDESGGNGRGQGAETTAETTTITRIMEIPSLSQAILLARISQSLHDKAGLYVQYRRQFSLASKANFANADNYFTDDELFDDPFSYESTGYSSQLTWMLPWAMKVRVGGALVSKNYISENAFTSADDSLGMGDIRLDDRGSYYVNFSKVFYLNKSWIKSLHFKVNYSYIRNESNSYWYDYKNTILNAGIRWNF
jgi:hypothetical protein